MGEKKMLHDEELGKVAGGVVSDNTNLKVSFENEYTAVYFIA